MIRPIVHDPILLGQRSAPATQEDIPAATDLRDTLEANADRCVGMAANMIGVLRRIIVFDDGGKYTVMLNPEVIRKSEPYDAQEGCLSLDGVRTAKRYRSIKVQYMDEQMRVRLHSYSGFTAQIIQHEIDHCDGILI